MGRSFDDRLAALRALREQEIAEPQLALLQKELTKGNGFLVAEVAKVARLQHLTSLTDGLVEAFGRFLENGAKTDPNCHAKMAILDALGELGYLGADLYRRGVRCVQLEASWGPPVDTAINVRANSGLALVRIGAPDARFQLTRLLADPYPGPRISAIRGLAQFESEASELVLLLKAQHGDEESEVLGECFSALLACAGARMFDYVCEQLGSANTGRVEQAVLAIGESRQPTACQVLLDHWGRLRHMARDTALLAIALTRAEEAWAFLLQELATGPRDQHAKIFEAMHLCFGAPKYLDQLVPFLTDHPHLRAAYEREFA